MFFFPSSVSVYSSETLSCHRRLQQTVLLICFSCFCDIFLVVFIDFLLILSGRSVSLYLNYIFFSLFACTSVFFQSLSSSFYSTCFYTDKLENQIFLRYKEIQNGAVAMSYMINGLLIRAPFLIFMTLQLLHSEFP